MTPIDKKINRKVAAKATNGLILVAIGAGFAYYSETGPWLHRVLDNFGLIVMAVAAYSSFWDAWKLFRTPKAIRYLLAIREEFGKPDEPVKLRNGDRVPTGPTEIIN